VDEQTLFGAGDGPDDPRQKHASRKIIDGRAKQLVARRGQAAG
jgi:hypothetical protein